MRTTTRAAAGTVVFFLAAPGIVAGVVPWWLTGWEVARPLPWWGALRAVGVVLIAAGVVVLISEFTRFVLEGRGTPSPVAPTERLVVGGAYRYVRNPMYVAVLAAIVGQGLALGQPVLFVYGAVVWAAVAVFVRWYEEPTLRRQFGDSYEAYRKAVPAWWPRRRPWSPEAGVDLAVTISATAERVWQAIVDPQQRAGWWAYLDLDAQVGGSFEERWTDPDGRPVVTQGQVTDLVAGRLLRLVWADHDWDATTDVEITLEPAGEGTTVRVRHRGWERLRDGSALLADHRAGWRMHLDNLRAYLEDAARA